MSYYLILMAAVILMALQFSSSKAYEKRCGSGARASLRFSALSGGISALVCLAVALITGESLRITPYSLLLAAAIAVLCCTYTFIGFRIMKIGTLSVFTLFLMLGGMLLPYLFGVLFLEESVSLWRIIGVILLTLSLVFPVLGRKQSGQSAGGLFLLLCGAVFLLNGGVSICSKLHQINTAFDTADSATFSMLANALNCLISTAGWVVLTIREKRLAKNVSQPSRTEGNASLSSVSWILAAGAACNGISYILQLISAGKLPASVMYPMITGGNVVLSALAGLLFFREKPDRLSTLGLTLTFAATFLFLF